MGTPPTTRLSELLEPESEYVGRHRDPAGRRAPVKLLERRSYVGRHRAPEPEEEVDF